MNRAIEFRGRADGEWFIGDLTHVWRGTKYVKFVDKTLVEQDTIGQFTGLHDRDRKPIFEGDIVEFCTAHLHSQFLSNDPMFYQHEFYVRKQRAVVEFREGCFCVDGDYLYGAAFESVEQAMRILEVEDKDNPFDSEGTEINESIVGYKVIGNIHDNPELLEEEQQ